MDSHEALILTMVAKVAARVKVSRRGTEEWGGRRGGSKPQGSNSLEESETARVVFSKVSAWYGFQSGFIRCRPAARKDHHAAGPLPS